MLTYLLWALMAIVWWLLVQAPHHDSDDQTP